MPDLEEKHPLSPLRTEPAMPSMIGPYRVLRELGRGAMGIVWAAHDDRIGRPVAIKVIQFGRFHGPEEMEELRRRFTLEATAAGRLNHPGIVTIYEFNNEGAEPYLVLEYVEGPSLQQIAGRQPIPLAVVVEIISQTSAALDYAHRAGIIHRDVKPANLLLRADHCVKLTDFGVAKLQSAGVTRTTVSPGTPAYMAPEQIQSPHIDGRADQFSLAVVAYKLLTGQLPFPAEEYTTLVYQILHEEPVPAHDLNRSLPPDVHAVLRRALAKNPADRYGSCGEFAQALTTALSTTVEAAPRHSSAAQPHRAERQLRRVAIWGMILLTVCLTLVIYLGQRTPKQADHRIATDTATPLSTGQVRQFHLVTGQSIELNLPVTPTSYRLTIDWSPEADGPEPLEGSATFRSKSGSASQPWFAVNETAWFHREVRRVEVRAGSAQRCRITNEGAPAVIEVVPEVLEKSR